MRNLLLQLRDNDVHGPVLPQISMPKNVQWEDGGINHILAASRQPLICRCRNYSAEQCMFALEDRASVNNAPSTLSQDYWNFNENDLRENDHGSMGGGRGGTKRRARETRNVFEKLNPVFKSLVAAIESTEATAEDIEEAFQDILKIEEKFKERYSRKGNNRFSSKFVSSNLADNPRRKTHGTKHWC
jgi:hypothetical protein